MNQPKKSRIPLLLAALIGGFILFLAWSGKQASTSGTDITDRDYYSKGLKYNSTLVEKRAARVIGWQLKTILSGKNLSFILTDKNNQPITTANGFLILPEPGNNSRSLPLEEINPGIYQIELPPEINGERLTRVDFELNGARINRQLLLNLSAPAKPQGHE